jgi:hypothetical protein
MRPRMMRTAASKLSARASSLTPNKGSLEPRVTLTPHPRVQGIGLRILNSFPLALVGILEVSRHRNDAAWPWHL